MGDDYFDLLQNMDSSNWEVLDVGCGSGRWIQYLAPNVKFIEGIDPSEAVNAAAVLLNNVSNKRITMAEVNNIPFPDNSFDLVYSLGVLHHIPDTEAGIYNCIKKTKKGGYLLLYLYYSLDNRGFMYKSLFHLSTLIRKLVSSLPQKTKAVTCDILALLIYMPWIIFCRIASAIGLPDKLIDKIPLSYYKDKSFYIIRNDTLDRFGTPLEKRFSKKEIESILLRNGIGEITFSNRAPFWHVIGKKI